MVRRYLTVAGTKGREIQRDRQTESEAERQRKGENHIQVQILFRRQHMESE